MGRNKRRFCDFAVADAGAMHKSFMRQVHQVVHHQAVVALDGYQLAVARPGRVVVPMHVGHQRRVGFGRVAWPDPHKTVPLQNRKTAHTRRRVERFLARHVGAVSLHVVDQPVVAASDFVAIEVAQRQRHQPMPASVFQRSRFAIQCPEKHHLQIADGARQQATSHFDVVGAGVPRIKWKLLITAAHGYVMYTGNT